jgi:superoxide dismutase
MRETIDLIEASTRPAKLETTPLPYSEKALEPVMSKETVNYHFEHLAKGYAKKYNAGEGNPDFNRAGSFLHNKFFPQLQAPKGANRPRGAVLALIEENFKTYLKKLKAIDAEQDNLKGEFYLQSKIEAHLEMLCLLGFMEVMEQTNKKKK